MIHHFSIAARQPQRVAEVLAEILNGQAFAFPPVDGGFIAICEDGHGTAIEVYPLGTEMLPGEGENETRFACSEAVTAYTPTHAAISVSLSEAQIMAIARREGWRAVTCDRGGVFHVIEFWVENRMLLELLPPEMAAEYLQAMTPHKWAGYLEMGVD